MNLVLAHGFLGFQRRFQLDYFNGLAEFLTEEFQHLPLRVLVSEVNPVARVAQRGRELSNQILAALAEGQLDAAEPVHIIGHSMGGLDARWAASPGNPENIAEKIATISTVSTPHRGSPVADFLTAGGKLPDGFSQQWQTLLDLGAGILDLTSTGAAEFNARCPDHPAIRYYSYAGRGRDGKRPTSLLLWPAYWLIDRQECGGNDGLVSLTSAAWGESPEPPWLADHADEIGHDLNRGGNVEPAFDFRDAYRRIVARLTEDKSMARKT